MQIKAKLLLFIIGILLIILGAIQYLGSIPYLIYIPEPGKIGYQVIIVVLGTLALIAGFNKNIY